MNELSIKTYKSFLFLRVLCVCTIFGSTLNVFITIGFIITLIFLAWKSIHADRSDNKQFIINKCWLVSTIIIVFSQINDVTYYDGRISIIFWILLSGLKNIIV